VRRNVDWFARHAEHIAREHAGRHVCVAGAELFVGDDLREVFERARQAHPADADAVFSRYLRPSGQAVPSGRLDLTPPAPSPCMERGVQPHRWIVIAPSLRGDHVRTVASSRR
jgi:hypothetical protein